MTSNIKDKLKFAQGALGVRMKRTDEQPLDLVEIFRSRNVDLTGADGNNL